MATALDGLTLFKEVKMAEGSYHQFCPVAMASEVLCTRWTMLLLREFSLGATRFNDLRRGLPRMSPALLSKRLKDLEIAGIVTRVKSSSGPDLYEYRLTEAGQALAPVIDAIGKWGHQWITTEMTLANLDVNLLMWNMRRNIDPRPLPSRRRNLQVIYKDLPQAKRNWWLIVEPGREVDLCWLDPGFDVDLYLTTDLRTMTEVWMGCLPLARARESDRLIITGDRQLEANLLAWPGRSPFATMEKFVA
jgi:DNA-binding HxlR family transcriptional regulator